MTLIVEKLEEIHIKFLSLNNLSSILQKNYIGLFLDKYI